MTCLKNNQRRADSLISYAKAVIDAFNLFIYVLWLVRVLCYSFYNCTRDQLKAAPACAYADCAQIKNWKTKINSRKHILTSSTLQVNAFFALLIHWNIFHFN